MCTVVLAASLIHNRSTHVLVGEICEIHDYALELKVSFSEGWWYSRVSAESEAGGGEW